MILIIRNMVTGIGQEHKFSVGISIKNNLQCLCVDKSFDLSYLMSESDIDLLKVQNFDNLNIRAAISFDSGEKYGLDIDKPVIDQLKSIPQNVQEDYFCEIHILINDFAPMKELESESSEKIYQHLVKKSSGREILTIESDIEITNDSLKGEEVFSENVNKVPNNRVSKETDGVWIPDDISSDSDDPWNYCKRLIGKLKAIIKRRIIGICFFIIIIAVLIISCINYFGYKSQRTISEYQQCLIDKNYTTAINIYNEKIDRNPKIREEADAITRKLIEEISTSCISGNMEYADAQKTLTFFEELQNEELVSIVKTKVDEILMFEIKELIKNKEYKKVVSIYNGQAETHPDQNSKVDPVIEDTIETISTSCFNNKIGCYEALTELDYFKSIDNPTISSIAEDKIKTVTEYHQEKNILGSAMILLEHGSYFNALKKILEIIDSTLIKQDVQNCYDEAKKALLDSVSTPLSKEDYEKYIELITACCEAVPDDKEFEERKTTLEKELKELIMNEEITALISTAKEKKEGGDLIGALDIMINAKETYGSDNELINKAYDEYHTEYIGTIKENIDAAMSLSGYSQAQDVIKTALEKYPNDSELKELKKSIEEYKPKPLNTMNLINSDNWNWDNGVAEDPFQNTYTKGCNYVVLTSGSWDNSGSVEYRINKEYSNLIGKITPQKDMGENGSGYIQVYADGVLKYTSPLIRQKTDAFDFSADMRGADYLKIKIHLSSHSAILLSDLRLTPSWGDNTSNKEYTPITALTILNESDWQWENSSAEDLFDTDYTHVCNYKVLDSGSWENMAYVEYRINQKYSKITGKIAPSVRMGENGSGYLEIYSGDDLLYKSDNISGKSIPVEFEKDISGIEYLKIYIRVSSHSSIILSDVKLWP